MYIIITAIINMSINSLTATKSSDTVQFTNFNKYLSKSGPIPFKCPFYESKKTNGK